MDIQKINNVDYYLPGSNEDVIQLVNEAVANNQVICLRGAAHSFPIIGVLEKGSNIGTNYKYVMLSKMFRVNIDEVKSTVTVQAGCHLGHDPFDPTGISKPDNSLLYQLDQKNLSLPDLGGITHQTVGGFLSTASSGGSTQYSFEDSLISIDIVACEDGKASVKTFTRPEPDNPDDPFYGVGVASLGLFGVIVSATFKCGPKFFIAGQEAVSTVDNCEIDFLGNTGPKPGMELYLRQTPYTRLFWWPQENVKKAVVWKAWQSNETGAKNWAWNQVPKPGEKELPLKPYQEVPYIGGSPTIATLGADLLFTSIGEWPNWLLNLLGDTEEYRSLKNLVETSFYPVLFPKILDIFVKPDTSETGPQRFADTWWNGLPMDNQMSDKLFPVWFTELWIDISLSQKVMTDLLDFYNTNTENTGTFCCEIYAAKNNNFWLSPSYKRDVIRIDVLWFANDLTGPTTFYERFWKLLAKYNFRPHWGKYMPDGNSDLGVEYLKSNYPKWENWRSLRRQLDPKQVFVNDYWRGHLDIHDPVI